MAQITKVIIGIQARSTSKRLPGKVFEEIEGVPLIEHVLEACRSSAVYLNKPRNAVKMLVELALLVPSGDEIVKRYKHRVCIYEGSENDVLSRYTRAAQKMDADFMVRITADCPMLPSYPISKHVMKAVLNNYDYFSNVDERCRTAPDGLDCEVISRRLLEWGDIHATLESDREHVTTLFRREPPEWALRGHVINYMDLSGIKISVDTAEDLQHVRDERSKVSTKLGTAKSIYGDRNVHRF